uniref:Uncharacterized protein n=1 Tax=Utricularia reniformis TaxID=192314 RepID=A0A1Y0B200_9LAMI|nr:hypothetical protein AEK19_MT1204 [Utricularia reniformis]ART31418.1 hypothetical protein AEK19_MT1204 [Utricularia reniformis]
MRDWLFEFHLALLPLSGTIVLLSLALVSVPNVSH